MALPSAPALTPTGTPYTKFSKTVLYIVPTIANYVSGPTLAELNAGKNVTTQVANITGFDTSVASLPLLRMGQNFAGDLGGRETASASSVEFYASDAGPSDDVRTQAALLQNAKGYAVFFNEGINTGGYMDVWPYRVGSVVTPQGLEVIAMITVNFNIYNAPARNLPIPTA